MSFLITLLSTGMVMSIIMLSLAIIFKAKSDIFSAKTRYTIWIIILVGLLIPFRPKIISPLFILDNLFVSSSVTQEQGTIDLTTQDDMSTNLQTDVNTIDNVSNIQREEKIQTSEKPRRDIFSLLGKFAIVIWLAGAIFVFSKYMIEYAKFCKYLKRWSMPVEDEEIIRIFKLIKLKLDIENKDIGLIRSKYVSTPMLTGLIRPVVVIPEKEIEKTDMKLIIEHELTHYKHKDLYVNLLSILVLCLHWFNPIVYYCIPAIQGDGELYCDETVLKNKNMNYRKTYGKMIINMIPTISSKQVALSTCFYSKKLSVKRRLINIMKNNTKMKKISTLSIATILGATILSGSFMSFAANNSYIGVEKAKSIALKDAGVSNVTFVKAKLDTEDGVKVYDVEFYKGNVEYDYEIDAKTGTILEMDAEIENYTIPTKQTTKQATNKNNKKNNAKNTTKNTTNNAYIGVEKAKAIALKDAGLGSATFTKVKLDTEDGVKVYDVEFYKGNVEYDYEIDAKTGKILEKDTDIENYIIPTKQTKNNNAKNTTNNAYIGVEKAKAIALKDAGLGSATFTKVKLDTDDGVKIYDIKFRSGNMEYDYEIDAKTGTILEMDAEIDD